MSEKPAESLRKKWIEPVVAVLMALTTLCTAWCSYESAAWTRQTNRLMNESNALERSAALLDVQGSQALIVHTSMFMQLLAAQHAGNEQLASFYAERFPPDVKKAYDAWLAQKPFENRAADAHPFVPNLYQVRGAAEAADAVCTRLRLIQHATSLGAVESTIERRASVPGQEHLPPSLLRLSVGIEGVEYLWADLDRALRVAVEA